MLSIQKKLIRYNYSKGNKVKYLVIHDTGNTGRGADALSHYKYFNGGDRQASAHYFVDDSNIIQTVEHANASWHCGDGRGKYGITNYNSIGIEICINKDGNYSEAVSNAVDLTKHIMDKLGISASNVVRHYDASRKNCPGTMSSNNWAAWKKFKERIEGNTGGTTTYYRVMAGAFKNKSYAQDRQKQIKNYGYNSFLIYESGYYKVVAGSYSSKSEAARVESVLERKGIDCFISIYKK